MSYHHVIATHCDWFIEVIITNPEHLWDLLLIMQYELEEQIAEFDPTKTKWEVREYAFE